TARNFADVPGGFLDLRWRELFLHTSAGKRNNDSLTQNIDAAAAAKPQTPTRIYYQRREILPNGR
ncbi:MAG: hypothetical protein NZ769_01925, partial [Anaerolineae bacterium]|nr:hypothetical protein [Anaerolineae bacterium]